MLLLTAVKAQMVSQHAWLSWNMHACQHGPGPKGPKKERLGINRGACIHNFYWQVQLSDIFSGNLLLLLPNNSDRSCSVQRRIFYGDDVKLFVNMSWSLWELCENSQLKCEDSYLKLHFHKNRTFTSFNYWILLNKEQAWLGKNYFLLHRLSMQAVWSL